MSFTKVFRIVGPLLAAAAIALVLLPLSPTYDLNVFLRAGGALLHGTPVYPRVGSPEVYSGGAFVYPYFASLPFAPLAALPSSVAVAGFFWLCVVAVSAACLAATGGDPWRTVLVLLTSFTITGLQLGAISPLLFVGAVFMWRVRERPLAFGLVAAPVLASKLFLAPLLLWPLLAGRRRSLAWASVAIALLLAAGFALGPIGLPSYLQLLSELGAHEARAGFGLIGALRNAGVSPALAEALAVLVAASVVCISYARYRRHGDEGILFCAGILAALLLSPVVWSHYFILLAAPMLVLGLRRRWFLLLLLAGWTIAPPHGVIIAGAVRSVGLWPLVLLTALFSWRYRSPRVERREAG